MSAGPICTSNVSVPVTLKSPHEPTVGLSLATVPALAGPTPMYRAKRTAHPMLDAYPTCPAPNETAEPVAYRTSPPAYNAPTACAGSLWSLENHFPAHAKKRAHALIARASDIWKMGLFLPLRDGSPPTACTVMPLPHPCWTPLTTGALTMAAFQCGTERDVCVRMYEGRMCTYVC